MKIAIRMDDITPDMDWKSFLRFQDILKKYDIKPLLGIVPLNEDENLKKEPAREDFWKRMKAYEEEGYCLALHGWHHKYETKKGGIFPLNHFSEFAGLPEKEQRKRILEGKEILASHGIKTDIFMAPAHTFDKVTLKVLKELGFSYVTDGYGNAPYKREGMIFLPISFYQKWCLTDKPGVSTMVIHINDTTEKRFQEYEELFKEHHDKFISYSDFLAMEAKKRGFMGNLKEYVLVNIKSLAALAKSILRR